MAALKRLEAFLGMKNLSVVKNPRKQLNEAFELSSNNHFARGQCLLLAGLMLREPEDVLDNPIEFIETSEHAFHGA